MTEEQRRSRKRKRERRHKQKKTVSSPDGTTTTTTKSLHTCASDSAATNKSNRKSSFLDKMKARLSGGHFRMINEKLYTCTGDEALEYFKEDPALFNVVSCFDHISAVSMVDLTRTHRDMSERNAFIDFLEQTPIILNLSSSGYQEQMSHWPEQPNDIIIKWIKDHSPSLVVADFGCGDARLAKSVKNKVFSIDLVSNDPSVIACDMSNTSLETSSIDVAVFCLSLMGINFSNFLKEAHRVLKSHGWLLIAEVKSRFDPSTGGADPNKFVKAICELGFSCQSKDFSNKMFLLFYFKKKEKLDSRKQIEWPELKPCLYKRR